MRAKALTMFERHDLAEIVKWHTQQEEATQTVKLPFAQNYVPPDEADGIIEPDQKDVGGASN